ncbi:MAG: hypothetical protein GXY06_06280 [Clostridiaceae bacterium]|nr:hypothetical protein [Clostridiaceae bacterium]
MRDRMTDISLLGDEELYRLCLGAIKNHSFGEAEEYAREFIRRFSGDYRAHVCILEALSNDFNIARARTHETSEAMRKIRVMAPSHVVEVIEKQYQAWVSTPPIDSDREMENLTEIAQIQLVDEKRYLPEADPYIDFSADQLDEKGIQYIHEKNYLDAATVYQSYAIRFPKDYRAWWGRLRAISQDFSCVRRPKNAGIYFHKFRYTAPKAVSEAWAEKYFSWSKNNRMAPNRMQYEALMKEVRHQHIRKSGRQVFIAEHYYDLVSNSTGQHAYTIMLRGLGFMVQVIAWIVLIILVLM